MVKERDIYQAPEEKRRDGKALPAVDITPSALRARTRRTTIGFVLLMVVFITMVVIIVNVFEKREKERMLKEVDASESSEEDWVETPGGTILSKPVLPKVADPLAELSGRTLSRVDREKLAKAMGEVRIAKEYLDEQEWDGAEIHARRALEAWPEMNAAKRLIGFVYTQRGQFDQAITVLEQALESEPFSAETFNNLASAHMQKWELEKAEDLLTTALDIHPNFAVAHVNIGLLYVIVGNYEGTIDHLHQALELVPGNVSARNNLGVAYIRVGRYDEARKHLRFLTEQYPGRPGPYINMAISYVYERNFTEAMKYIRLGAGHCSPVTCRNFLADSDFDAIRGYPAFQAFINNLYPDLPALPPAPES